MNMMMTKQAALLAGDLSKEFNTSVGVEAHSDLIRNDSDYNEHLIINAIISELDGLAEAKKIMMLDDESDQKRYIFFLTYQSVKMDNIECLAKGMDSLFLEEVIDTHRDLQAAKQDDGCYLLPIYALLESSYASLESLGQLLERQGGLDPKRTNLICEIISQEKHIIAKLERLAERKNAN